MIKLSINVNQSRQRQTNANKSEQIQINAVFSLRILYFIATNRWRNKILLSKIGQHLVYFEILQNSCKMFLEKRRSIFKRRNTFPSISATVDDIKMVPHNRGTSEARVGFVFDFVCNLSFVVIVVVVIFSGFSLVWQFSFVSRLLTFWWNFVQKARFIVFRILPIGKDTGSNGIKYNLHVWKEH